MIQIKNLHASVDGKEILRGLNLEVKAGEVHAIMGPNGSGKSTLASVLAGREDYEVTEGEVIFNGKNLLDLSPEDRAREGLFLAFQYPIEIPGVSNINFLKTALNDIREYKGLAPIDPKEFLAKVKEKQKLVELDCLRQIQPFSAAAIALGQEKRLARTPGQLATFYLRRPHKLALRLSATLRYGFSNRYITIAWQKPF